MRRLVRFVKQIIKEFGSDRVGQLSSAFAYAGIFALGPLLLVLVSVIGLLYGQQASQGLLAGKLVSLLGSNTAKTVQDVVASTNNARSSIIGIIIGGVALLLTASALLGQLQSAFNQIFKIDADPKGGFKLAVLIKLKNAALVMLGCVVLVAIMTATAVIGGVNKDLVDALSIPTVFLQTVNIILAVLFTGLVVSTLYQVVPRVKIGFKVTLKAGLLVGALLVLGSQTLLGYVISRNGTATAYGAAASLIALLLWFYYTSQIIFLGAEGIKVYGQNQRLIYPAKEGPRGYNKVRKTK